MLSSFILMSPEDTVVAVCPRVKVAQLVVAQNRRRQLGNARQKAVGKRNIMFMDSPGAGPTADAESGN